MGGILRIRRVNSGVEWWLLQSVKRQGDGKHLRVLSIPAPTLRSFQQPKSVFLWSSKIVYNSPQRLQSPVVASSLHLVSLRRDRATDMDLTHRSNPQLCKFMPHTPKTSSPPTAMIEGAPPPTLPTDCSSSWRKQIP